MDFFFGEEIQGWISSGMKKNLEIEGGRDCDSTEIANEKRKTITLPPLTPPTLYVVCGGMRMRVCVQVAQIRVFVSGRLS